MDSGVVVLDGVGAAMGDEPLAYCEGCRAARTIGDPGECPPGGLDLQEFPTVFVVQIDRRDLVETDRDARPSLFLTRARARKEVVAMRRHPIRVMTGSW